MTVRRASVLISVAAAMLSSISVANPGEGKSNMGTVYLVLLKKGPAWSTLETAETKALQEAHMANIHALWEAKGLAETDPAVKAGRLVADVHPWCVEKRALPEAGSYCPSVTPR